MKTKYEMQVHELVMLRMEYERMLSIARDRNCLSQEFRLEEMIEELDEYIEQVSAED